MDKQQIEALIRRYNAGEVSEADIRQLEELIESGAVAPDDLETLATLHDQILDMKMPAPSSRLDERFYAMIGDEKRPERRNGWRTVFSWPLSAPSFAFATLALLVGLAAGFYLGRSPADTKMEALSHQVTDLQEMVMFSLLEKGSPTERLKAVNLTQQMSDAGQKVTNALLHTLNEDDNVNVRLAALEALKPYAAESSVREALIRSISKQDSPLVQVALAELMVALQEKSSVQEFEKIVESDKTPAEVKKKIKESIDILI